MKYYPAFSLSLSLLVILVLTGCSSKTTPKTHYYLIAPDYQATATLSAPPTISVECAPFLSQGGLVMENGNQTILTAHYHRWAEPLPAMISRYLQRRLQTALSPDQAPPTISLLIDRFHQQQDGLVVYSGQWWIKGQTPQPFRYQERPTAHGYEPTVTTLHHLLDQQSQALADLLTPTTLARTEAP